QDMNLILKWETMLISLERCLTFKNKETKMMIRDGVPSQFRARLWKVCIDVLIKEYRANASVNSYSGILDMVVNKKVVTPFANQIELDLLRTLPNNKHFSTFTSSKIISLRNILLAFSIHNPDIGYCQQGLNRVGGILLLVLSEEEAFWGLVAMVEVAMPTNYYNRTLMAAHADQRVLKDILADKLPTLSQHFSSLNFEPSLFTFSWFLTIFVDNLPVSTFLRIWDTFLYEGSKVLFRYALAIMKFYECKILSFQTATELNMFIRSMCENLTDVNRLSQIAFNELNPFPMRAIKNKRVQHLSKLKMELVELEKLRQTFQENLRTASDEEDKQEDADSI
ncbi:hypothetical protein HELRODRAFT_88787, partial [Helobdella robusta]|uniref:Rab-GAP TBC domain-containing protein n=1 Tax=Helobdella robusta TaxID=6412 RepID=T1G764_HELRO